MAVVDATVLAEYLGGAPQAELARAQMAVHAPALWAPYLVDAEVGQVLRRGVRSGRIDAEHAAAALDDLLTMRLRRIKHRNLVSRAWELRDNLSFYDALYVALAEMLEQPLLTFDARLGRASGVRAEIQVLPQLV